MATQNSLILGSREYRGVIIRPALGGAWKVRTVGRNSMTDETVIFDVNARSLQHARDIIILSLKNDRYLVSEGNLTLNMKESH